MTSNQTLTAETLDASKVRALPADPPLSIAPGTLLADRYLVQRMIARGGMGAVYRACDIELNETVALKVPTIPVAESSGLLERFRSEVRLARRVTHPNVARVFDIVRHGALCFLTMELVEGESLAARARRLGRFALADLVPIVAGACAGLAAAHAARIVHRDLKPENLLIRHDGQVLLTDFGIACGVHSELLNGAGSSCTPAYVAPEQIVALSLDGRADIYALGVVLYQMLTGESPFGGDTPLDVVMSRLTEPPPDPRLRRRDLPDGVAELILSCMAIDREERPGDVMAVSEALRRAVSSADPVIRRPSSPNLTTAGLVRRDGA